MNQLESQQEDKLPSPGSKEAYILGCNCPRLDNHYGKGAYINDEGVPQFWINGNCTLHGDGPEEWPELEPA